MTIYYSTNPVDWGQLDGIYINEVPPPASVQGVGTGVVGIVSKLDWGIQNSPVTISNVQDLNTAFGYFSNLESQLTNLKFSSLYVVRAAATTGDAAATAIVKTGFVLNAKYVGAGGNFVQYSVADATDANVAHFKLLIQMNATTSYNSQTISQSSVVETYDNIDFTSPSGITAFLSAIALSNFVTCSSVTATTKPTNIGYTSLAGGTTGSPTQSDYTTALNQYSASGFVNIVASDQGTTGTDGVNTAIYQHIIANKPRIGIVVVDDVVATAETQVISFRESTGAIIAVSGLVTKVDGYGRAVSMPTQLMMASTLSSTSPSIDPAYVSNNQFFQGVTKLSSTTPRLRADYITLKAAGICAPEFDPLYNFKFKSGVTTQIINADLKQIYTRRMSDYLERSVAVYLVNFQNGPNTVDNRNAAKSAIISFINQQQSFGLLPSGNNTYLVDVKTANTAPVLANNQFIILWKQQLISSMASIVLTFQAGASVQVQSAAA